MDVIFLGVNEAGMRIYEWLCDREGVTVLALMTERTQLNQVRPLEPDIIVAVGFRHLVPPEILTLPPEGAVNLHPALLPYNRGANPNVWPLVEGTPAGVTLHYMDEDYDTGDVIAQREVETNFVDTGESLHERLKQTQFDLFREVWPDIEAGSVDPDPQDSDAGTYHVTTDFQDLCKLDPYAEVRVKDLLDRLRALTYPPFDNAYLELDGERYYVDLEVRSESSEQDPEDLLRTY